MSMAEKNRILDPDFQRLKEKIRRERKLDCNQYKDSYLVRRFNVRMRARATRSYRDYIELLDREPSEYDSLLDDLTINVTQFFRDLPVFQNLEEEVLPLLIYHRVMAGRSSFRIWSAGCSSGEEPYSIAILMRELLGEDYGDFSVTIMATDIDEEVLAQAQEGCYLPRQLVNVPKAYVEKYFDFDGETYKVADELKEMVQLRKLDLFSQTAGTNFDMILCRNVVIYFTKEMQENLYMKFHRALGDGGYFVMGNTETLLGEASRKFIPVKSKGRIYQKREHPTEEEMALIPGMARSPA